MMEHYFSKKPKSAFIPTSFDVTFFGHSFSFVTGSGVFSIGKVDNGSRLLVEHALVHEKDSVLDYGCGWGFVGIVLGKAFPSASFSLIDVNRRALQLSKENILKNNVTNVSIISSVDEVDGGYDAVLLNPPQKAGKSVCFSMISEAFRVLKKKGTLQLVARHQKGGKMLRAHMGEVFGNVKDHAKGSGFRVYLSEK